LVLSYGWRIPPWHRFLVNLGIALAWLDKALSGRVEADEQGRFGQLFETGVEEGISPSLALQRSQISGMRPVSATRLAT
jgi:hypothetical protein